MGYLELSSMAVYVKILLHASGMPSGYILDFLVKEKDYA